MKRGYVKLWRKSLKSEIFKGGERQFYIFMYLLMKTTHHPHEQIIGYGSTKRKIILDAGQCVCGLKSMEEFLGINQRAIGRALKKLVDLEAITRHTEYATSAGGTRRGSNTPICSVVTICNWDKYQASEDEPKKDVVHRVCANKQEHTTTTVITLEQEKGAWLCSNVNCPNVNSEEELMCLCGEYR